MIVAALLSCLVRFEVNGSPAHFVRPSACVQLLTFLVDIPRIDLAFGLSFLQLLYHTYKSYVPHPPSPTTSHPDLVPYSLLTPYLNFH